MFADESAGSPERTALVLLHDVGPLGCPYEVHALFEAFRGERPVFAPDLPGFGGRPALGTRDALAAAIGDLVADLAARQRGSGVADVVAIGATGAIAARAILRRSARFRSLAVVAPPISVSTHTAPEPGRSRLGSLATRALDAALDLAAATPLVGAGYQEIASSRPVVSMLLGRRVRGRVEPGLVVAASATRQARAPSELRHAAEPDRLGAALFELVKVPLLFVYGSPKHVAYAPSGAREVAIAGARGMPHVERSYETAEALRAFFRTVRGKPDLRLIRGTRAPGGPHAPPTLALAATRRTR